MALALAPTVPARPRAQSAPPKIKGVIELFTSQGCGSCPPADVVLAEFAADPEILALGYHVDYWDYMGWRDTLANPQNTQRQYAYAAALGHRGVYTPQAVLNGQCHRNGGRKAEIIEAIERMAASQDRLSVPIDVAMQRDRLSVFVGAGNKHSAAEVLVSIAFFRTASPVVVERGDNAGRSFTYANAVTSMQTLGLWDGSDLRIQLPKSKIDQKDADGCAVLLQVIGDDGAPGPILGAANLTGLNDV